MTSQQIIAGCRKNRRKEQNALHDRYKDKVMGICLRFARSEDEAKDLCQESFMKIFKSLKSARKIENLESWIHRITVNHAIDDYNKLKRRIDSEPFNQEEQPWFEDEKTIIERLDTIHLLEIINRLPTGFRMIFNLYMIDGFSHEEIAGKLQISTSTSRSQLTRAKRMVKNELKKIDMSYEKAI